MEDYLGRLEGPIATQVWNRFISLAKDVAASVYTFKMQIFPTLRLVELYSYQSTSHTPLVALRLSQKL